MLSRCTNLYFPVCSLGIMILLLILFYWKKSIENKETKIYSKLIIVGFVEALTYSFICFISHIIDVNTHLVLYEILNKFIYIVYILWFGLLFYYEVNISFEEERINKANLFMKIIYGIEVLVVLAIVVLPVEIFFDAQSGLSNSYGMSANALFLGVGLYIISIIIVSLINLKRINTKKYTPMFVLIFLMVIAMVIRIVDPLFNIYSNILSLVTLVMYFTIENPDVKMLEQVEKAKEEALKANQAKGDFLSSMSHEIRTPLNAIVGFSEDISNYEGELPKQIVEDAKDIASSADTLLEIVGNLLDISKIEGNEMEVEDVPYNFKAEIEGLARMNVSKLENKPIDYRLRLSGDIPDELIGDRTHVKEIVNNLLTNAIKYTEKGTITLTAKCTFDLEDVCNLIIFVEDTGKGISEENQAKLFNKFERLDAEINSANQGTGLGLAITKQLLDMLGGKINVQSTVGEGSLFAVQIPQKVSKKSTDTDFKNIIIYNGNKENDKEEKDDIVELIKIQEAKEDEAKRQEIARRRQMLLEKKQQKNNSNQETVSEEQKVEESKPASTDDYSSKTILIVDDNKMNIKVAEKALARYKPKTEEAMSGQECLDKVNNSKYDLIFMDIMMPGMDGTEALKKLSEMPNFNIPVVALTADAVAGAREKYLGLGFSEYVAKPFKPEQLKNMLDRFCQ